MRVVPNSERTVRRSTSISCPTQIRDGRCSPAPPLCRMQRFVPSLGLGRTPVARTSTRSPRHAPRHALLRAVPAKYHGAQSVALSGPPPFRAPALTSHARLVFGPLRRVNIARLGVRLADPSRHVRHHKSKAPPALL